MGRPKYHAPHEPPSLPLDTENDVNNRCRREQGCEGDIRRQRRSVTVHAFVDGAELVDGRVS